MHLISHKGYKEYNRIKNWNQFYQRVELTKKSQFLVAYPVIRKGKIIGDKEANARLLAEKTIKLIRSQKKGDAGI